MTILEEVDARMKWYKRAKRFFPEDYVMPVKDVRWVIDIIGLDVLKKEFDGASKLISDMRHYSTYGDFILMLDFADAERLMALVIKTVTKRSSGGIVG